MSYKLVSSSFNNKTYPYRILSCSVGVYYDSDLGKYIPGQYEFNDDGPVYGPNGELELDPDNYLCSLVTRPVFATCKNNCPGGELCYQLSVLSYFVIIKL